MPRVQHEPELVQPTRCGLTRRLVDRSSSCVVAARDGEVRLLFTSSFSSLPTLKNGRRFGGTGTGAPVRGLRPSRLVRTNGEAAEAADFDAFAALERLGHRVEDAIDDELGAGLREVARAAIASMSSLFVMVGLPEAGAEKMK